MGAIIYGENFMVRGQFFSGSNFPRGQLSGWQFPSVAIIFGGNCARGQSSRGQSSKEQLPGGQFFSGAIVLEPRETYQLKEKTGDSENFFKALINRFW